MLVEGMPEIHCNSGTHKICLFRCIWANNCQNHGMEPLIDHRSALEYWCLHGMEEVDSKRRKRRMTAPSEALAAHELKRMNPFSFMVWLMVSRIWWGLAIYISIAIIGLLSSAFQLKDTEFICPKCNSVFKPSLRRTFFSTGSSKVRWMTCPECGHKNWCVLRKQEQAS